MITFGASDACDGSLSSSGRWTPTSYCSSGASPGADKYVLNSRATPALASTPSTSGGTTSDWAGRSLSTLTPRSTMQSASRVRRSCKNGWLADSHSTMHAMSPSRESSAATVTLNPWRGAILGRCTSSASTGPAGQYRSTTPHEPGPPRVPTALEGGGDGGGRAVGGRRGSRRNRPVGARPAQQRPPGLRQGVHGLRQAVALRAHPPERDADRRARDANFDFRLE